MSRAFSLRVESLSCLNRAVLPEGIWFKAEGFGEADVFPSDEAGA